MVRETKCAKRLRIAGSDYVLYKKAQRKPEAQEIARWLRVMRRCLSVLKRVRAVGVSIKEQVIDEIKEVIKEMRAKFKVGDMVKVKRTVPKKLSSYVGKVGKVVRTSNRKGRLYYVVQFSYPSFSAREDFLSNELTRVKPEYRAEPKTYHTAGGGAIIVGRRLTKVR